MDYLVWIKFKLVGAFIGVKKSGGFGKVNIKRKTKTVNYLLRNNAISQK